MKFTLQEKLFGANFFPDKIEMVPYDDPHAPDVSWSSGSVFSDFTLNCPVFHTYLRDHSTEKDFQACFYFQGEIFNMAYVCSIVVFHILLA